MKDLLERTSTRPGYLVKLRSFIESSSNAMKRFSEEIGWPRPSGSSTSMTHGRTEVHKHIKKTPEAEDINEYSEEPLLPSLASSPSMFSVKIDAEKQRSLLHPCKKNASPDLRPPPASAGELTANFTREERLILYEHTLKNAAPVAVPPELLPMGVASYETKPKELSELELKKAMRDFKRRRQAYRTKVSTKNKSQTQITREIIHNMMGLLGGEEPDLPGTPNMLLTPTCNPVGSSDSRHLDKHSLSTAAICSVDADSKRMRDVHYSKCQELRMKRNKQESHKRSRNSEEHVKDEEYSNTCSDQDVCLVKGEKYRTIDMKHTIKCEGYEGEGSYEKYQSRHKNKYTNRESNQCRENKRQKSGVESELRYYECREARRGREVCVREKHEELRRQCRESTSGKSQKRDQSDCDHKNEYHSSRENSKGSKHCKSKRYKHGKSHSENGGLCGLD